MCGILKRKLAQEKLALITDIDFDTHCTEPLSRLREAAGIFHFIYEVISCQFIVDTKVYNYPESYGSSFMILYQYGHL